MSEIHPFPSAAPPPPQPSLLLFDDDDGFGDFTFASSPAKPDEDDDWGEFVSSPIGSQAASSSFDPFHDPAPAPPSPPAWERPRGAIPLSIFGDDEVEETDSPLENGFSSSSPSTSLSGAKDEGGAGLKGDLKDLIVDLYGFTPARVGSDAGKGGDGDFEWDFRGAFSPPDGGIEKEEKVLENPVMEKIEFANGHGIEFAGDRTGKSQEAISRHRSGNIEHDMVDVYAASGGTLNGFCGPLVVDNNYSIPETNQHSEWTNNGDALQDSLENRGKGDDDEWEFQNALSVDVAGSIGNQFAGDRMGESKEAATQHRSADIEHDLFDSFAANGGVSNDFYGSLVVDNNYSISETNQQNISTINGNALQDGSSTVKFVGDRTGESKEVTSQQKSANIEHNLFDSYAGNGGFSNDLYGSLVINSYSISERNQQSESANNGHPLQNSSDNGEKSDVLQDSLETGEKGDDDEWEFQNAFSVDVAGPTVHQFVGDRIGESKEATTQHRSANIEHNLFDSYAANGGFSNDFFGSLVVDNNFSTSETNPQSESTNNGNALLDSSSIVKFVSNMIEESKAVTSQQRSANIELDLFDIYAANGGFSNDFYGSLVDNNYSISERNQQSDYANNGNALQNNLENGEKSDDDEWEFKNAFAVVEDVTGSLGHQKILDTEAKSPVASVGIQAEEYHKEATSSLEHNNIVLKILGSASKEEQHAYTTAWSKMAQACARELHHGAMIWAESVKANISPQLLSQGIQYFIALGEIYRVTEILRASLKLYRPWILSSEDNSSELLTYLEESAETWINSGLEKALESISSEGRAQALLQSIRSIHDLDEISLRDDALGHENIICKLSLLPIRAVPGMGSVVWDGEHYYLKLANLWANRVSCDPVQLPRIHVS